jgi:hypothetical protein
VIPVPRTEAIIVNHDTSPFVELALRSLLARHHSLAGLGITVMDNGSSDPGLSDLQAYAAANGIRMESTGFSTNSTVNSHGEVLRDFVMAHPQCDYYLLLDADICFLEEDTIGLMHEALVATPDAWAVQPRATWDAKTEVGGRGGFHTEPDPQAITLSWAWADGKDAAAGSYRRLSAPARERCHPFCTLVRNDVIFRSVADHIGFSEAWIWENRGPNGGYYDTLALASRVMKTHGRRWICATPLVLHFFNVSYAADPDKIQQCQLRLTELRQMPGSQQPRRS